MDKSDSGVKLKLEDLLAPMFLILIEENARLRLILDEMIKQKAIDIKSSEEDIREDFNKRFVAFFDESFKRHLPEKLLKIVEEIRQENQQKDQKNI